MSEEEKYSRFMFIPILLIMLSLFIIGWRLIGAKGADAAIADALPAVKDSDMQSFEDSESGSWQNGTADGEIIDINRATAQELETLDGIGEKTAAAIVATREKMGGFRTADDLLCVENIGEETLERLKPRLTVSEYGAETDENAAAESGARVNINTASREELMTLDGIGAKKADAIIELREKIGGFSEPHDIVEVRGIGEGIYERLKDRICVE